MYNIVRLMVSDVYYVVEDKAIQCVYYIFEINDKR